MDNIDESEKDEKPVMLHDDDIQHNDQFDILNMATDSPINQPVKN